MGLRKEYVRILSAKVVEELTKHDMIEVPASLDLAAQLFEVMDAEVNLEDRLNDEVRTMLNQYSNEMRQSGASYQEMFKLIKKELLKKRGIVRSGGEGGKLPRSKVIELSHQMVKELSGMRHDVELLEPANEVRLELVRRMQELLRTEANIDQGVRQKIHSLKRGITEGSEEWDILFRKYYTEEMRKLGVG